MGPDRFARHRLLLTEDGLSRLAAARVAVCGAGGLGSTVLTLLARTGVGYIRIYDKGRVDTPDLNRQLLYYAGDLGRAKAELAAERLLGLEGPAGPDAAASPSQEGAPRPSLGVEARVGTVDADTDFGDCDLVVDCLDNFAGRFAVDEATYEAGIPLVHAGVYRYFGQITSVRKGETACLRDLFGASAAALDAEQGKPMYPPAVVCVASLEAAEAINLLLGVRDRCLYGRLLSVDLASLEVTTLPFG